MAAPASTYVLRNMFREEPAERPWEPMPLQSYEEAANGEDVANSARSSITAMDSGRECFRRRAGYICVDSTPEDDFEDLEQKNGDDIPRDPDLPLEPLPESIYGFAIASLIADSAPLHEHPKHCFTSLGPLRILTAFLLCMLTFCMQLLLIVETKRLVTPSEVKNVREVYGIYEKQMYKDQNGTEHVTKTINGYDRGDYGFFNESNFESLSKHDKTLVCRIPLSQPMFCFMVLFVWTLTVLAHMRDILSTSLRILAVRTVDHEIVSTLMVKNEINVTSDTVVSGLTIWMKGSILLIVQIPRMMMACILLWLGCRWLIATVGFGDLLLNCVALEFILGLAGLLYNVLVPYSGKMLVRRTLVPHLQSAENENVGNMFGMLACGVLAGIVVWVYMWHLQAVLPHYHWDVRIVCAQFLDAELGAHDVAFR